MSLAEKFEEYLLEAGKDGQRLFGFEDLQRALYFGAEAQHMLDCKVCDFATSTRCLNPNLWLEIDHFRSHK